MLNKKFFSEILKNYTSYSSKRHEIIKLSSDALRMSKQSIFALHRDDFKTASDNLRKVELIFKSLEKKFVTNKNLAREGSYLAALEEYVEAKMFYKVLNNKKVDKISGITIDYPVYLAGICDLTGELTRKALAYATLGDVNKVEEIKENVTEVVAELIRFNLTGKLRLKYEEVKRNLKKLEEILYDLKLRS